MAASARRLGAAPSLEAPEVAPAVVAPRVAPAVVVPPEVVPARPAQPIAAAGFMLIASFMFALMSVSAKVAMRELPFTEVAAGRAAFGALFVLASVLLQGQRLVVRDRRKQWARTILGTASMVCTFLTLSRLPVGDATTLGNLMPLMLGLVSPWLLGERSTRSLWGAAWLGFAGVALLAGVQVQYGGERLLGVVSGVAGAAFACFAMVQLRRLGPQESAGAVSFHFLAWAAVAFAFASLPGRLLAAGGPWPSVSAWLALVVAGTAGGAAQVAMTRAYALDQAARVSTVGFSGVLMAQLLGLWLGERPTLSQVFGAGLVVASGSWTVRSSRR